MGQPWPFLCIFLFFFNQHFYRNTVDFSSIQTRIVRVEDEQADQSTTTTARSTLFVVGEFNALKHAPNLKQN